MELSPSPFLPPSPPPPCSCLGFLDHATFFRLVVPGSFSVALAIACLHPGAHVDLSFALRTLAWKDLDLDLAGCSLAWPPTCHCRTRREYGACRLRFYCLLCCYRHLHSFSVSAPRDLDCETCSLFLAGSEYQELSSAASVLSRCERHSCLQRAFSPEHGDVSP